VKLHVITACMFATEAPIWRLKKSCERFGIDLHPYGMGQTYTDWPDIKITKLLAAMKAERDLGATHILYTDGRDSFFLAGLEEIESKYVALGSPGMLMAAETGCYPREWLAEKFPDPGHHFRWPGSGQFMGQVDKLIADWEWLWEKFANPSREDQNEQGWMVQMMADGNELGWVLDTGCEVFQSAGNGDCSMDTDLFVLGSGRIANAVTESLPCAIHFNGGYSDPVTGKDAVMAPVWDALGMGR